MEKFKIIIFSATVGVIMGAMPFTAQAQTVQWGQAFSEEGSERDNNQDVCLGGIGALDCSGGFCDWIKLGCLPDVKALEEGPWSKFISEERPNNSFVCPTNTIATGLKCQGGSCDDIALRCDPVDYTTKNCNWSSGTYSEENTPVNFGGKVMTGLECHGSKCDDKKIYMCDIEKRPVEVNEPASGKWVTAFAGGQNSSFSASESLEIAKSDTKTWGTEQQKSLEISISTTVDHGIPGSNIGASTSIGVTGSTSKTTSRASEIAKSKNVSYSTECVSEIDLIKYDVHKVWQWQVSAVIDQIPITIKTCEITCTPNADYPKFLPNQDGNVGTCQILRSSEEPAPSLPVVLETPSNGSSSYEPELPTSELPTPELNGETVVAAMFNGGSFEHISGKTWGEFSASGDQSFTFEETGRDEWSVYLRDTSRNVDIAIDLWQKKIKYGSTGGAMRDLYTVTDAEAGYPE